MIGAYLDAAGISTGIRDSIDLGISADVTDCALIGSDGLFNATESRMAAKYRRWTPEVVRSRIKTALLVKALQDHAVNGKDMAQSQITAALGLLRKVMPDLTATTLSATIQDTNELSTAEIVRRISALEGAIGQAGSESVTPEVH